MPVIRAVSVLMVLAAAAPAHVAERRCGWLSNPTPANWWLTDRSGEWIIGVQGGYQAPGMDDLPDMTTKGWVNTNGSYGYGCACMTVTTNPKSKYVTKIIAATPMPLRQCRRDPKLRHP